VAAAVRFRLHWTGEYCKEKIAKEFADKSPGVRGGQSNKPLNVKGSGS